MTTPFPDTMKKAPLRASIIVWACTVGRRISMAGRATIQVKADELGLQLDGAVINEIGAFEAVSAMLGVLLTGILLVGLLERRNPTLFRAGYDSLAVIVTFVAGVVLLYTLR